MKSLVESEDEIINSHFENKILKKQKYTTKYLNNEGKHEQKEQQYFIASFYRDAKITESKDFKNGFIKTPRAMKSCPNTPTTFATLFSRNDSGIYPEKIFEYFNPAYTYCGFIYDNFHTAFWSKVDNDNQRILAKLDGKQNEINELCQKGKKRAEIKKMFGKADLNSHQGSYGESVRPGGKEAPEDYLSRMDYLRHRIETDVYDNNTSSLITTNLKSKDKNKNRYGKLTEQDHQLTIGVDGNERYISGFGYSSYINHIVFNKKTKQIDEKTACNEFVSLSDEKVSSLILFLNIQVEKSFDEKCMNTMLKNYAAESFPNTTYTETVANVVGNIKKMLFAQKDLGIPYMPIFGGYGKVLCVKLSVVLQAIKDTEIYKKKNEKDKPEITDKEIKELQDFEASTIKKLQEQSKDTKTYKKKKKKKVSFNENVKIVDIIRYPKESSNENVEIIKHPKESYANYTDSVGTLVNDTHSFCCNDFLSLCPCNCNNETQVNKINIDNDEKTIDYSRK